MEIVSFSKGAATGLILLKHKKYSKERGAEARRLLTGRAFTKTHFDELIMSSGNSYTSFLTRAEGQLGDRLFPPIRR
jgi:hypothetical protein